MPLHRLTSITIGVPNVAETAAYYTDFGLTPRSGSATTTAFSTVEGGEQLRLAHAPTRRLLRLGVGVSDRDDLDRIAAGLSRLDASFDREATSLRTRELGHVVVGSTDQERARSSSPRDWASRRATRCVAWPRSCAAPPTTTTY